MLAFNGAWASIHGLRTAESARAKGLATGLMVRMAQAAQARGIAQLFLQVETENTKARSLYERLGFASAWQYAYWSKE